MAKEEFNSTQSDISGIQYDPINKEKNGLQFDRTKKNSGRSQGKVFLPENLYFLLTRLHTNKETLKINSLNIVELRFENEAPEEYVKTSVICNNNIEVWLKKCQDKLGYTNLSMALVSQKEIMAPTNSSHLFYCFGSVERIQLNNFNTSEVENAVMMFSGFRSLIEADLSKCDFSKAKSVALMFDRCSSLEEVKLPENGFPMVESLTRMFINCESLKKVKFPEKGLSNVVDVDEMFSECTNLKEIDLSKCDFSTIRNANKMFGDCINLERVNLSNLDIPKYKNAKNIFKNCNKLYEVNLDRVSQKTKDKIMKHIDISKNMTNTEDSENG